MYDEAKAGVAAHVSRRNWREEVTIGIAALCESQKTIVSVSDLKISFGGEYSAADAVPKTNALIDNWSILYAGSDVADVDFVLTRARELLSNSLFFPDALTVAKAVDSALAERLQEQIEAQILRRYGLTADTFLNNGKLLLKDQLYNDISSAIAKASLSTHFILCGFDENGDGHIVLIDGDSPPKSYDTVGFCAIGSGANVALSNLAFHREHSHLTVHGGLPECIYCCCAAKFMSESATDIRDDSFVTVTRKDTPAAFISGRRMAEIREAWKKYGAPKVPTRIVSKIPQMIHNRGDVKTLSGFDKAVKLQKRPGSETQPRFEKAPGLPRKARNRFNQSIVDDAFLQPPSQEPDDQT